MGAVFQLEHANIMAYVTSRSYAAPRVLRHHLSDYLDALSFDAQRWLISERGEFEPWPEAVGEIARRARSRFLAMRESAEVEMVSGAVVEKVLEELRSEFSDYPLFALAVGNGDRLREEAHDLARSRMYGQLLVLIPEQGTRERNFEVLDPIPAFSVALHAAAEWPGFVFWTSNGASSFAPLPEIKELHQQLLSASRDGPRRGPFPPFRATSAFDQVLRKWTEKRPKRARRLLHLSDLHFGTTDATENQSLLEGELQDIVKAVDRVVITGDLFDAPKKNYATQFTNFRNRITALAHGREPISITGNHDQRMLGMFGADYAQVSRIGQPTVEVDDACQMIFVGFNSSIRGSFARGKITQSQFRERGAEYRNFTAGRPELKEYLPIVLVHHHPFSFDVPPETLVQRVLSAVGLRDETFLEMVDAEDLHRWCLDWKIKTILHGHKHKARYVDREVTRDNEHMFLTAIGCGSSLGAEGSPVSYNMLEWDSKSQRWVASFFESINGGAFREKAASISPEHVNQR